MNTSIWTIVGSDILKIVTALLSAFLAYMSTKIKKLYEEKVMDETKKSVIKTVVKAMEQIYENLSGKEKLKKAQENIIFMLKEKGITITDLEMNMMIEEICHSFKKIGESDE